MISVVVADDHPFVLHGVANVLRSNSEITVVTACNDGSAAWSCRFCSRNARGCSNSGIAVNPAKVPKTDTYTFDGDRMFMQTLLRPVRPSYIDWRRGRE